MNLFTPLSDCILHTFCIRFWRSWAGTLKVEDPAFSAAWSTDKRLCSHSLASTHSHLQVTTKLLSSSDPPTKWHFIWHIFWDSIWHPFWHKYRHSSWNLICILSGRRAAKLAWSRLCWWLIHGGIWTILEFRWRVVMLNKIEQSPLKLDLDFLFLIFWIILALVLLVSTFCSIEI